MDELQILDFVFISYYWWYRIYYNHIVYGFENDPENNPKNDGIKWKECSEKISLWFLCWFFFFLRNCNLIQKKNHLEGSAGKGMQEIAAVNRIYFLNLHWGNPGNGGRAV